MFCSSLFNNYPILPMRQVTPTQYMPPAGTGMAMPTQYPAQYTAQFPSYPVEEQAQMPHGAMQPVTIGGFEQGPPTTTDIGYIPAFLKTQIGKRMRIQFLVGTDSFLDKAGTLVGVGISYILLKDDDTGDIIMADMYSIKFVNIFQ